MKVQRILPLLPLFLLLGAGDRETALINTLKTAPDREAKEESCRALAQIGTKDAVPALAALLGSEELSHMARYALEPIPDPSVDEALRAALGQLKGRLLAGVLQSIGVRRDAAAVEAHRNSDHFRTLGARLKDCLAGGLDVERMSAV